ncbi:hypothetical protein ABPG77_009564 [Micractinium sp. CCAP 211/92]
MEPPGLCPAASESHTAELTFDGIVYLATVHCAGGDLLEVVVERKDDASVWSATYAAKYVEEITAKTGSFKRFPVFVRMLLGALRQESDSVSLDLLTYSDLELLRSKRAGASSAAAAQAGTQQQTAALPQPQQQHQQQPQQPPGSSAAHKRYLILTYAAEFDRVHYPLPLQYEDNPDPRRLKATIGALRAQLAAAGAGGNSGGHRRRVFPTSAVAAPDPELRQLRQENAALQAQLAAALEGAAGGGGLAADVQALAADAQEAARDVRGLRRERDSLLARVQAAEAALESERALHRRELRRRGRELADAGAELGAAKEQIRELRLKCRGLAQAVDLAQRRAAVAGMSAGMARQAAGGLHASYSARGSRAGGPGQPRGASPAGGRYHSRGSSPAPIGRAPLPGLPPRSRSAEVSRPGSRPSSAGRFDPTEYVRAKRDRERQVAARLDEMRRSARMQPPGASRGGILAGSRPPSMPSSRHSTPQRSRVPSRDPAADRARMAAGCGRPARGSDPRGRSAAVSSTERLRAAVSTTPCAAGARALPPREQRATSPGRALHEVRERLQQYAQKPPCSSNLPGQRGALSAGRLGHGTQASPVGEAAAAAAQLQHVAAAGVQYGDASAEIADIDSRLQSLQNFLRLAKAGQPVAVPS